MREIDRSEPDGQPFDTAVQFSSLRRRFGDLRWEPDTLEGEVSLPTLLLHGARDARIPLSAVERLAASLPDAALIEFTHVGHDLLRWRSAQVTAIALAMAGGGLQNAVNTRERVRHHRPRRRLLEFSERRQNRRLTRPADAAAADHETHERRPR